ncbi:oligosaccharyl transferase, archaeosortase A system-associated, partial [Archaeoglobales archaeon]
MKQENFLERHYQWLFIFIAIILGAYIRIANPWNLVFVSWLDGARLSGNDPWYYFRIVDNSIRNFPNRIWFDAFTHYPVGTYTHFGPFLSYVGVIASLLLGATSQSEIRTVLSFIPVLGGVLLVLPVYLLTTQIFGKKAGIISALLVVFIPGQLLHRSILSFNDHHIWETFWQIATLGLFALAYNKTKGKNFNDLVENKKNLLFPVLAGIALGLYLDTWSPGFIIALIIFAFVFLTFLVKFWLEVDLKSLSRTIIFASIVGILVYLPFAFKHPFLTTNRYNPFPALVLLAVISISVLLTYLYILDEKRVFRRLGIKEEYTFSLLVILLTLVVVGAVSLLSNDFIRILLGIVRIVQPKGGSLTVAEIKPFFIENGEFSLANAWGNFSMSFFFAIPGMVYT